MDKEQAAQLREEAVDMARRIAGGEDVVSRICTMRYFTYRLEGEDVIFGDDLKAEVELVAGASLEEVTPVAYPGDRVLRFKVGQRQEVLARLPA